MEAFLSERAKRILKTKEGLEALDRIIEERLKSYLGFTQSSEDQNSESQTIEQKE